MKKRIVSLVAAASLMLTLSVSAFAGSTSLAAVSQWAVPSLVDGERLNIYPISWYEADMSQPITKEQTTQIVSATGDKLSTIAGAVVKGENPVDQPAFTRGAVLTEYAQELAQIDLPGNTQLEQDVTALSPVDFMKKYAVLLGNGVDYALDAPCTMEQAALFGTRLVISVYNELEAGARGFMWKAEKNGNTVYMLGSIHVADDSIYPYREEIMQAFNQSKELHVEVNTLQYQILQDALMKYAPCPEGKTLKDYVSAETYKTTIEALAKVGISEDVIAPYKPWYVTIVLGNYQVQMGKTEEELVQSGMYGMDMYLMSSALTANKPIVEIESAEYQYKMFDDFSPELQEYQLLGTAQAILNDQGTSDETAIDQMLKPFLTGDIKAFEAYSKVDYTGMSDEERKLNEEYMNALLTVRNVGMADAVAKLLDSPDGETHFVVVGALHYLGQDNVIDLLKAKGYNPVFMP